MSIAKLLYGLAALPLIAGVAFAQPAKSNDSKALAKQPTQLSEQQMDKVTAGWDWRRVEYDNTGITAVSVWQRDNVLSCEDCGVYLLINNKALSVGSIMFAGPIETPKP
jgi:hypothetical protein